MARAVTGSARRPPMLEVSALFGRFRVPGSDFTVRFASTFANSSGHQGLLSELKPMRDRVEASALSDLTALLQRDLNDRRVAQELIPYLLGARQDATSRVGFFPAVLAVLIPRDYLRSPQEGREPPSYPTPEGDPDGENVRYLTASEPEYAWEIERYMVEDQVSPVGLLRVNTRDCEIVVLDGQHRSNAFRYLAGDFDPSREVYGEFYRDVERPATFDADLPVTVVWFETSSEARVEPRLISRQLFVDVNNSANAVSLARTILLDDRSVSALATQEFYNRAAERSFEPGGFSLLHAAFDMDSDIADTRLPLFALTSPEIVENCFLWLLLGTASYSSLRSWRVERLRAQRNRNQFVQVLGTGEGVLFGTDDDDGAVHAANAAIAQTYRRLMRESVVPVVWSMLEGISMLQSHYRAAERTREWVTSEANSTVLLAWDKIFTGGEGLYWTFSDRLRQGERNQYAVAIDDIERRFREDRARDLGADPAQTDNAFRSFGTKAFQIGFVMAVLFLADRGSGRGNLVEAAEVLLQRLGAFSASNWLALFREVRPLVLKGDAAPRMWPSYRNLLLRMHDEGARQIFTDPEDLPETYALGLGLRRAAASLRESTGEFPERSEALRIVRAERDRIQAAFAHAGMSSEWFANETALEHGLSRLQTAFDEAG